MFDWLQEHMKWLGKENWWIAEVFFIVFGALLIDLIQKRFLRRLQKGLERTKSLWDDAMLHATRRPITFLIWLLGITFAAQIVAAKTEASIFSLVEPARKVGIIAILTWTLIRFISYAETNIIQQSEAEGKKIDRTTADAVSKLLRISVLITSALVILQTLGFSISGVLAFGGIGGIAVGFAAKDLLANFFGGLMIYLDRPFAVGDWIRSPDKDIEGVVEKIGWRLTCIRRFNKRPLYVPNAVFTSVAVENPSRMTNRRIYETIGVRYDDVDKLPAIVADVEDMLRNHPEIDQNQTLMVNFNSFGASSLDFFIYALTKTTKWEKYHEVKQDVLFKVSEIISSHGAEIAFPTSTIHVPESIRIQTVKEDNGDQ